MWKILKNPQNKLLNLLEHGYKIQGQYSRCLLLTVVTFHKATMNTILANAIHLLLGKIKG